MKFSKKGTLFGDQMWSQFHGWLPWYVCKWEETQRCQASQPLSVWMNASELGCNLEKQGNFQEVKNFYFSNPIKCISLMSLSLSPNCVLFTTKGPYKDLCLWECVHLQTLAKKSKSTSLPCPVWYFFPLWKAFLEVWEAFSCPIAICSLLFIGSRHLQY